MRKEEGRQNTEDRTQKTEDRRPTMQRERANSFRELLVWQKAHQFVLGVYRVTAKFPAHETYGLSVQLRRAAVSVPANIVEGFKRRGKLDKLRFLNIAASSLEESRYYLLLAEDLRYAGDSSLEAQGDEVARLLGAYSGKIAASLE
jgi:four helix bundle protein